MTTPLVVSTTPSDGSTTVTIDSSVSFQFNTALDQTTGLPAENRKAIENWAEVFKNGRDSFKLHVDKGFEQAHRLLAV